MRDYETSLPLLMISLVLVPAAIILSGCTTEGYSLFIEEISDCVMETIDYYQKGRINLALENSLECRGRILEAEQKIPKNSEEYALLSILNDSSTFIIEYLRILQAENMSIEGNLTELKFFVESLLERINSSIPLGENALIGIQEISTGSPGLYTDYSLYRLETFIEEKLEDINDMRSNLREAKSVFLNDIVLTATRCWESIENIEENYGELYNSIHNCLREMERYRILCQNNSNITCLLFNSLYHATESFYHLSKALVIKDTLSTLSDASKFLSELNHSVRSIELALDYIYTIKERYPEEYSHYYIWEYEDAIQEAYAYIYQAREMEVLDLELSLTIGNQLQSFYNEVRNCILQSPLDKTTKMLVAMDVLASHDIGYGDYFIRILKIFGCEDIETEFLLGYGEESGVSSWRLASEKILSALILANITEDDSTEEKISKILKFIYNRVFYENELDAFTDFPRAPVETLALGSGDCDDFATLASALFCASGVDGVGIGIIEELNSYHAVVLVKEPVTENYIDIEDRDLISGGRWYIIEPQLPLEYQINADLSEATFVDGVEVC